MVVLEILIDEELSAKRGVKFYEVQFALIKAINKTFPSLVIAGFKTVEKAE